MANTGSTYMGTVTPIDGITVLCRGHGACNDAREQRHEPSSKRTEQAAPSRAEVSSGQRDKQLFEGNGALIDDLDTEASERLPLRRRLVEQQASTVLIARDDRERRALGRGPVTGSASALVTL
jgi:hypothetical protein